MSDVRLDASDKEVRKEATANAISVDNMSSPSDQLITYFYDWRRLKKAVPWFLRLKGILLERSRFRKRVEEESSPHTSM